MENPKQLSDSALKAWLSGNEMIIGLDGRNIKFPVSVLQEFLGIQGPSGIGGVVPNEAFVPGQGSAQNPAIYFAGPGTYSGFGGMTLTDEINIISWNGTAAVFKGIPIVVPDLSGLATKAQLLPLATRTELIDGYVSRATGNTFATKSEIHPLAAKSQLTAYALKTDLSTLATQQQVEFKIDKSQKGAPGGVATLNSQGKIPASQINLSSLTYQGNWDPVTNTPPLVNNVGTPGHFYTVSRGGDYNFGHGFIEFNVGDTVIFSQGDNNWVKNAGSMTAPAPTPSNQTFNIA